MFVDYVTIFFIKDDFTLWFKLIDNNIADYIYPISLWTYQDASNDHFGIANKENFMKIWKRDMFIIMEEIKTINDCPEKILVYKLIQHNMKVVYIIPDIYQFKGRIMILNRSIQIQTTNNYMHMYLTKFINLRSHIFRINLQTDGINDIHPLLR